jgi:hypothetical protein
MQNAKDTRMNSTGRVTLFCRSDEIYDDDDDDTTTATTCEIGWKLKFKVVDWRVLNVAQFLSVSSGIYVHRQLT